MTEEMFGESLAAGAGVFGDGFFAAVVDVQSGMFSRGELGESSRVDELGIAQGVEETVADELRHLIAVVGSG